MYYMCPKRIKEVWKSNEGGLSLGGLAGLRLFLVKIHINKGGQIQ